MAVESIHPLYQENLSRWQMMLDVCSGSKAVKSKQKLYLPMICPHDQSEENIARYMSYLTRAVFYPITKQTMQNHVGLAFAEDPTFEADGMDFLKYNADGAGTSIYQLAQRALETQLVLGRGGFLVDYPTVEGGVTPAQIKSGGIRPTIVFYTALDIINWRVRRIGNEFKLSLVVLKETYTIPDPTDEFSEKAVTQYRVLRLDEANEYCVQVYNDETGQMIGGEVVYPRINGKKLKEILFQPLGAQYNDLSRINEIPLETIAEINLAHYRNSAEYEQSLFFTNQVQPVFSELEVQDAERLENEGTRLGANTAIVLRGSGKFSYVKAETDTLAKEGMDDKKQYMQDLGAKLLDSSSVNKTATQVSSDDANNHSVLSLCVANLNEALEYCIRWCAMYHGLPEENEAKFVIKQDFAKGKISLEDLKFYQSEVVRSAMSNETLYEIMQTGKLPELSYEQEQKRIASQVTKEFV